MWETVNRTVKLRVKPSEIWSQILILLVVLYVILFLGQFLDFDL